MNSHHNQRNQLKIDESRDHDVPETSKNKKFEKTPEFRFKNDWNPLRELGERLVIIINETSWKIDESRDHDVPETSKNKKFGKNPEFRSKNYWNPLRELGERATQRSRLCEQGFGHFFSKIWPRFCSVLVRDSRDRSPNFRWTVLRAPSMDFDNFKSFGKHSLRSRRCATFYSDTIVSPKIDSLTMSVGIYYVSENFEIYVENLTYIT